MIIHYEAHQRFLKVLLQHQVKFLLIGGYAVNFHGYNRTTGDMDIWLAPTNENKKHLINALQAEDFDEEQLEQLGEMDFSQPVVFYTGQAPLRIDFLTTIKRLTFEEAYEQKVFLTIDDYDIPVINLQHLVLSKINNNRTQDKADIEALQKIMQQRKADK